MTAAHTARLHRITVYPIKSLDGIAVDEALVLPSGALAGDRRYALRDARGESINGKRNARVHQLRASYSGDLSRVSLRAAEQEASATFDLARDRAALADWLGDFFGQRVVIVEEPRSGFPDDTISPGPTLVGSESLAAVAAWFPGLDAEETRRRFRVNLEVTAGAPFWEDRLVAGEGEVVRFAIGDVELEGVTPCQRCVVPTRDSRSGDATAHFARRFADERRACLPAWTNPARFDHFYRLSVNTRPGPLFQSGPIRVGDAVRVLGVFRE